MSNKPKIKKCQGKPFSHNYFEKTMALGSALVSTYGPDIYHVGVYHDDWCGIFRGEVCNCNPDVERL